MVVEPGFLLVNKPKNVSSFSCVAHIKRLLPKKTKVGHAGTLDPFAQGLLILGVGREATRTMSALMKLDKVYVAIGKLGERTDTLDNTGRIIETADVAITRQQLKGAIASLGTGYMQMPPVYSALKYQGMPLYALARKQLITPDELDTIVAQKRRHVTLHAVELLAFEFPYFTIQAHVSHGTYVRSLIDDIAVRAGSCATTHALERIAIGPWDLREAHAVTDLIDNDQLQTLMVRGDCKNISEYLVCNNSARSDPSILRYTASRHSG